MGLAPIVFWRMTLAEWRTALHGHAESGKADMRKRAWSLSYSLIAAGVPADKVSVEKLLGEKEPRRRRSKPELTEEEQKAQSARIAWEKYQKQEQKRKAGE
jgi:hypothetical protein